LLHPCNRPRTRRGPPNRKPPENLLALEVVAPPCFDI
jgi:hypothetical protein